MNRAIHVAILLERCVTELCNQNNGRLQHSTDQSINQSRNDPNNKFSPPFPPSLMTIYTMSTHANLASDSSMSGWISDLLPLISLLRLQCCCPEDCTHVNTYSNVYEEGMGLSHVLLNTVPLTVQCMQEGIC